ncbi:MAG: acyl-CoA dehydrogenase family protein, partial [Parasphingorhabdus sp.]
MNFDFSDDQKFLRDEARKFLEAQCTSAHVREVLDDDDKSHNEDVWKQIVEMGWLGAAIPEEYGGLGLGMLELCVIAEELGRVLAPVPFGSSAYFFAEALKLAGSEEQKSTLLPKIADGSLVGCIAISEGPGEIKSGAIATKLSSGKISGKKIPVTDGDIATHAVVLVKDGSGESLAIVDLN